MSTHTGLFVFDASADPKQLDIWWSAGWKRQDSSYAQTVQNIFWEGKRGVFKTFFFFGGGEGGFILQQIFHCVFLHMLLHPFVVQDKEIYRWPIKESIKAMIAWGWTLDKARDGDEDKGEKKAARKISQTAQVSEDNMFSVKKNQIL